MTLRLFYFVVLIALAGCGDDGDSGLPTDAAPPVDARILVDAARQVCGEDADTCAALAYERVCDETRAYCVECLDPSDCQGEATLGPLCESSDSTCRCGSASDCVGNIGGGYCQPIASACGCLTLDDCPANSECEIEPYLGTGIRRCRPI